MPFIEDDWWCADNDGGKMVDFTSNIQDAVVAGQQAALQQMATSVATTLGDLTQTELSNIVSGLANHLESSGADGNSTDADEILKQLGEATFDNFDTFFTDLTNNTVSNASGSIGGTITCGGVEIKQEENNNISSPPPDSQLQNSYINSSTGQLTHFQSQTHQKLHHLQSAASALLRNNANYSNNNGRYNNIASANPLLAEKLAATPTGIKQEPISNDYGGNVGYGGNGDQSPMQRVHSSSKGKFYQYESSLGLRIS